MKTENNVTPTQFDDTTSFSATLPCRKHLTGNFDGGQMSTDGGASLLSLADKKLGLAQAVAACLHDLRDPAKIRHSRISQIWQRLFAIAMGYEDCNDHDTLNDDPILKMCSGKTPQASPLSSQPTLSRLENAVTKRELILIGNAMLECVVNSLPADTCNVVIDVDTSEDVVYGTQQLAFYHKFYDSTCYTPMLLHLTDDSGFQALLGGLLRPGTAALKGARYMLRRAIKALRKRFPNIHITVRGDAAFGSDLVCAFCERYHVEYTLRFAANVALQKLSQPCLEKAQQRYEEQSQQDQEPQEVCCCDSFSWQARPWKAPRKMLVKAIVNGEKTTRYFIVSNKQELSAEESFEFYYQRGNQENRIKELKLDLQSDRTSCHRFEANQFRLFLHCAANMLWNLIQRSLVKIAPRSSFAKAQIGTLQRDLIKVAVRVVERVKHIRMYFSSTYVYRDIWLKLHHYLSPGFG